MQLYSENKNYKLYHGNMLDMLEAIEPNTIDSVVTDPPYELNFMSKGWDNAGVSFQVDTWRKCYEVLKPGGYLLAFGGSRTFHRIACAIEDAGFEIRDTIMWLYGSGFPKSMDISKKLDKRNGRTDNDFIEFGKYLKEKRGSISQTEIRKLFPSKNGTPTGNASNWELGKNVPTMEQYKILKEKLDLDDRFDWLIEREEAEREVIGTKKSGGASAWINGMNNKENEKQKYTGFSEWEITAPSTYLAKQWQGWGTALKPSFEPIIVARKPFKGSLVDNVIENGVGGINIDECRVGNEERQNPQAGFIRRGRTDEEVFMGTDKNKPEGTLTVNGRFPANTILTYDETDFDEVCRGFPDTKTGGSPTGKNNGKYSDNGMFKNGNKTVSNVNWAGDSSSASRYFYCAKASKKDRDEGLDCFIAQKTKVTNQYELPRDDGSIREIPCRKNTHPTVKPTSLMQYLVRLVTPNGGTVLDPFNGVNRRIFTNNKG